MRLFTALVPSRAAVRALRDTLRDVPSVPGLRWVDARQWHITLGFFGADDADARAAWLRPRLDDMPAVRVRLCGAGTFRGVLWAGLAGDDLSALAVAAGAQQHEREFHPHLTIARGRPPGGLAQLVPYVDHHRGPDWQANEVVLMSSDRGGDGPTYSVLARYPLRVGR